jgi:hypothetical protein
MPMKVLLIILIVLLYNFVRYIQNRAYVKKVKFLEELLDSRLYCTFDFLQPTAEIRGKYKGRTIEFISHPHYLARSSKFILRSSKLAKQNKLMVSYPKLTENVCQKGDSLVYCVLDYFFTSKIATLGKSGVTAILDELLCIAEKAECGKLVSGKTDK